MTSIFEKIMARVVADDRGCWNWQGAKSADGYGRVRLPGAGLAYVHRAVFEQVRGAIPFGFQIDHLCRNPACCNPGHLEAVTPRVNMHRSSAIEAMSREREKRTHCRKGHELSPDASYLDAKGYRHCRECRRIQYRIQDEKRRENKAFHRTDTGAPENIIPLGASKNA